MFKLDQEKLAMHGNVMQSRSIWESEIRMEFKTSFAEAAEHTDNFMSRK